MGISEIIFPVIWCLIVFLIIVSKAKKANGGAARRSSESIIRLTQKAAKELSEQYEAERPEASNSRRAGLHRSELSGSVPASHKLNGEPVGKSGLLKFSSPMLMEDREHDWLAKQLKEEAQVMRRSDFLDLGASHGASCDARYIKLLHALEHDSSIDNGEY